MDNHSYREYLKNENVFKTLIEESPFPVGLYVGIDLVIHLVNKAILKVWGRDESVLGKTFVQALPEMEGQPFVDILKNVFITGVPYEARAASVDLMIDGVLQNFYFNFDYKPLKNEAGEVWGILNTADDVTELVLTRKKLAESEERMRFALDSAGLGTWDFDPLNETVKWDDRCKELYGFAAAEEVISYQDVLKHIHPDDRARVENTVSAALDPKNGGDYNSEFRTIGFKDKKIRWLRCKGKAYFNNSGECIRFAGTALDISTEVKDKDEQQKLITLIEHTSDFVSICDLAGNMTFVNAAGKKMMGLDTHDFVRPNVEFIMPCELARLNDINNSLLEKGRWCGEVLFRHFVTGEAIPVYATTIAVYDQAGAPQGRATVARDLRPEVASKKALIDSEQLLQNITSAAPTALWMADKDGLITYVNKTWQEWTGQLPQDTLDKGWLACIIPEDRDRTEAKFLEDLKAQRPYEVDFRLLHKNGDVRWCIATGNPQYDLQGNFVGFIGACTDVTETIQIDIELQLKNAELNDQIKQFEFVTDFMPVQLWTAKTNGELDYVNKQTTDFFGLPVKDIIGPKWLDKVHPDDRPGCIEAWVAALKAGRLYQYEFRLLDKFGEFKWHLARALPFINNGVIVKWFGTNTDINEQKELQRQKDDFLGIASHELKTPVTSVKAYAQVLGAMLSKEGEDKKAAMVIKMDAQLNRLTNLIGDLLDVTKINSGKILFNKSWFDFNQAVQECVHDLQQTTNRHILVLDFKETGMVYSDKDRIGQVITNLVGNAIKYSPHSNRVIISTELQGNEVVVCVQDFGIGIPEDKKEKVFEQFYRVGGDKQHTFPGLGLGLYISNEIIRREGGKMWVNSEEGKGSAFCFSLPADNNNVAE
jgi:PAS domain S-box-containing protein